MRPAQLKAVADRMAQRGEHISLESDIAETRAAPNPEKRLATFALHNPARGIKFEISILEEHYLAVSAQRRSSKHEHFVDLRFLDPKPLAFRHVAWRWLYAALAFTVLTAAAIAASVYVHGSLIQRYGTPAVIVLATITICGYLMAYFFTTESMFFVSVHGRAPLIGLEGNLGALRRAQPCAASVIKHIKAARLRLQQSKPAYLRDEMREHSRLFEQRVLTEEQYSDAKRRILKAHA